MFTRPVAERQFLLEHSEHIEDLLGESCTPRGPLFSSDTLSHQLNKHRAEPAFRWSGFAVVVNLFPAAVVAGFFDGALSANAAV